MRVSIVSSDSLSAADVPRLLSFASSCCVVSLVFSEWFGVDSDVARQLLTDPSMQSLQDVGPVEDESLVELIATLPQLTSFRLTPPCPGMDNGFQPDAPLPLIHARNLRTLFLSDSRQVADGCMPAVMQLTQLRSLSIYHPKLHAGTFVAFCSAMQRLESLELQSWDPHLMHSIGPANLADGFASLRCLLTLKFTNEFDAATLAPVLHRPPLLRRLVVTLFHPFDAPAPMVALLHAAPWLSLELHTLSLQQSHCTAAVRALLLDAFPDRVTATAGRSEPSSA